MNADMQVKKEIHQFIVYVFGIIECLTIEEKMAKELGEKNHKPFVMKGFLLLLVLLFLFIDNKAK